MPESIYEQILRQREIKNEKVVAVARLVTIGIATILDLGSWLGFFTYTTIKPTGLTIVFDATFLFFSFIVLFLLSKLAYRPYFKFFTIPLDYFLVAIMILFDPTIPKEGQVIYWIAMVASLFIFMLNLLRFSKVGTLYSAVLSTVFFIVIGIFINGPKAIDSLPMFVGLSMILGIGYSITAANINMMQEANAKKMMERYLPSQLVDELYKKNTSLEPGGKNQEVSILFTDIRSFTEICENLSAEETVDFLNDYLSTMTEIIFSHNGTIDKFIGDAIMTVFGAPISASDDTQRAVAAAKSMQQATVVLRQKYSKLKIPLEIGIGIHTGYVIAGNIGSNKRLDYTVIGDSVNLASRIEGLTKYYGTPILISQSSREKLDQSSHSFSLREIDTVRVKGKNEAITIFEVI